MKTIGVLFLVLTALPAQADECLRKQRQCASGCAWQHAACDIPSAAHCRDQSEECVASCYKDIACKAAAAPATPPANTETAPSQPPAEFQSDSKQPDEHQE